MLKYRQLLAKFYPSEKPSFISLEGYIDGLILSHAIEMAGSGPTTDSAIEALEAIRNLDLGLGTSITFGPSEHQGSHKVWALFSITSASTKY